MFSIPFTVKKSIIIEQSSQIIFNTLNDFNTWRTWSPWLCQEQQAKLTISGNPNLTGHSQTWNGERVGQGTMTLTQSKEPIELKYDLNIIKPWKSDSKVTFTLEEQEGSTKVSWIMEGSLPIFLFFMKKMMIAMIGNDYERGLKMLKDLIEIGEVHSDSEILGQKECDSFIFVGKKTSTNLENFEAVMLEDFQHLTRLNEEKVLGDTEKAMCLYHTFDPVKNSVVYSLGYLLKNDINELPKSFFKQSFPNHRSLSIKHLGPYKHLANAWSTAIGAQRHEKLKLHSTVPMYEIYSKIENEVEHIKDTETLIYIPLKV